MSAEAEPRVAVGTGGRDADAAADEPVVEPVADSVADSVADPVMEPVVDPWVDLGAELVVDEPFVKCWLETIPPGEARPAHVHRHPWVSVVLAGATGESYTSDGRLMGRGEATTGTVRFNGPDRLPYGHYFKNVSEDRTLVMLAMELRVPGGVEAWPVTGREDGWATQAEPAASPGTRDEASAGRVEQ
jgi:hypothetical protein